MNQARVRDPVQLHEHARRGPELRRNRPERVARSNRVGPASRRRERRRGCALRGRRKGRCRRCRRRARRSARGRACGGRRLRGRAGRRRHGSARRWSGGTRAAGEKECPEGRTDDHHRRRGGEAPDAVLLEGCRQWAAVDDDRERRDEPAVRAGGDVVRASGPAGPEAVPTLVGRLDVGRPRQPGAAMIASRLCAPPGASGADEERADERRNAWVAWLVGRGFLHVMECIAARAGCRATARIVNDRAVRVERPRKRRNPGDGLFSRKAALSVSSALESLTSVFGMGTGVASPLESPGFHACGSCVGSGSARARMRGGRRNKIFNFASLGRLGRPVYPVPRRWPLVSVGKVKPSTISTAWLHPSPGFHVPPIKQVVSLRSYPVNPVGNLISRRASHLDAFSAYPDRT